MTVRQTVSGMARIKPTGPHSHSQNVAAASTPIVDTPVPDPYSHGSMTLLLISSSRTNIPTTSSGWLQPSDTTTDRAIGKSAAIHGPTYGTYRSAAANNPHRIALGTPIRSRPAATATP
ncbi:hypothetical protein LzC2_24490 [Planctomycetes bacterium LzC2]|uniref:Uncharacterized protein n=1 Tax=Alienimonas chondri TaxID=2681879 RepID=A0ABX1VEF6_9PLAN|nr:hypothetical protein [Alienimonas chondri]